MKKPMSLTSCCQVTFYADVIIVVGLTPSKIRIGDVARCSSCHRIIGEARLDKYPGKEVAALQKKFSSVTFAMLLDLAIKSKGLPTPLNVRVGTVGLVPENYIGELKQQPEMKIEDDEVPF